MQLTASRRTQQRHTPPTADPEVRPTPSWSETCPICFRPKPGRVGMSCVQQAGAAACWLLCLRPVRSSTGSRWFVSRFWALKFRGLRPPDLPPVASREGLRCLCWLLYRLLLVLWWTGHGFIPLFTHPSLSFAIEKMLARLLTLDKTNEQTNTTVVLVDYTCILLRINNFADLIL